MFVFGRTVLVIVVILFCLPSIHLYSQSTPIQELQQQQGIQDSVEPPQNTIVDSLNSNPLHTTPDPLRDLYPDYRSQSTLPVSGKVMFYNPGIMEIVIENRKKAGDITYCRDCIGFAALLRAGDMDRKIWIQFSDGLIEGPFHVVDTAAPQHVLMLLERGWVADVDYETAMRWRMAGPRFATVLSEPPQGYVSPLELQRYDLVLPSKLSIPSIYRNEKLNHSYLLANDFDEINELFIR